MGQLLGNRKLRVVGEVGDRSGIEGRDLLRCGVRNWRPGMLLLAALSAYGFGASWNWVRGKVPQSPTENLKAIAREI
ncbi:hypothetical protein ACQ4M4_18115 [Leptolyngbya sp. AN02str]|uniref:hypothetical protein n=1 Tax=Leptolyngbya sp. AN02str TaxID=3423363 RepID=UPI003D31C74B